MTLSGFGFEFLNPTTNKIENVNLQENLDGHLETLTNSLDHIYQKMIKTLYKGDQKRLKEQREKLKDLRVKKGGGYVVDLPNGSKFVVKTSRD